jgi:ABC-2 type transport system permease protein
MSFNFQRLSALIRKETIQLLRDRRYIGLTLALSFVQFFLYAYAANQTVYHLPMIVMDQSQDQQSHELVQAMINSQYFDLTMETQTQSDVLKAIEKGQVKVGLVIPPDFSASLERKAANVLVLLDGADSFAVRSGYSAAGVVLQSYTSHWASETVARGLGQNVALPINTSTQVLYNPDLIDVWFVLPGVIGMILQTLAIEQAALSLVRERELGTLEQILATPVRQLELILSKMAPLLILSFLIFWVAVGLGVFWFGVPFRGSLILYLGMSLLFIVACLGLGLFIATRATTQLEAQAMSLIFMLFGILLSGFFYPRNGMPLVPALIGNLVPLTYFVRISRSIFLKGVGLQFFWTDAAALAVYTLVVIVIAARRYKMRLD